MTDNGGGSVFTMGAAYGGSATGGNIANITGQNNFDATPAGNSTGTTGINGGPYGAGGAGSNGSGNNISGQSGAVIFYFT